MRRRSFPGQRLVFAVCRSGVCYSIVSASRSSSSLGESRKLAKAHFTLSGRRPFPYTRPSLALPTGRSVCMTWRRPRQLPYRTLHVRSVARSITTVLSAGFRFSPPYYRSVASRRQRARHNFGVGLSLDSHHRRLTSILPTGRSGRLPVSYTHLTLPTKRIV